ncbi:MAG: TetR/AcrR family transcriptional regulator [Streptosporangiaceae bacterium]
MSMTALPADPGRPRAAGLSDQGGRLADAAIDLFYRQGMLATSVREITRACGLTPGALYNHFPSKDELLYRIVRGIHLSLESKVAEAQAAVAGDPVAELTAIVRVYVTAASETGVGGQPPRFSRPQGVPRRDTQDC